MGPDSPITAVAASVHAARLRDFPEIVYVDRDWERHREWFGGMSREERAKVHEQERATDQLQGPTVERRRRLSEQECLVTAFPQLWGSTALGFGGMGGSAMTTAYTVVVESSVVGQRAVYFGSSGRLAYIVPMRGPHEETFQQALAARSLPSVRDAAALGWVGHDPAAVTGAVELTGAQIHQLAQFAAAQAAAGLLPGAEGGVPGDQQIYRIESRTVGSKAPGIYVSSHKGDPEGGVLLKGGRHTP
ncbi:hypothetical protein RHOFW510R12_00475 [Rhodanobacter sp. FW510-R12]|uniref:hypothetical protein n=1 Tax=Rhodanobacter thiooxydans TaxID=416169 RepID=UPI000916C214|nr:hypothetical protein [Rhodanobacter thiooxydans]UJJ56716.1 hypothetical protein LRK53_19090 [Rhodanobacter thiooxydans]